MTAYRTYAVAGLLSAILAGCAADTAVLRVIEYQGGGAASVISGQAGGIAVHQQPGKAFARVDIRYKGERAEVVIHADPSLPAAANETD